MVNETMVDQLIVIIMAFHDKHPSVPVEDIKALVTEVGNITTAFASMVATEVIRKKFNMEDN